MEEKHCISATIMLPSEQEAYDIRVVEDRLNAPDYRFRDHLTGRLHP